MNTPASNEIDPELLETVALLRQLQQAGAKKPAASGPPAPTNRRAALLSIGIGGAVWYSIFAWAYALLDLSAAEHIGAIMMGTALLSLPIWVIAAGAGLTIADARSGPPLLVVGGVASAAALVLTTVRPDGHAAELLGVRLLAMLAGGA